MEEGKSMYVYGLFLFFIHLREENLIIYSQTAGVLVWQSNDCWPVTSWAIADYFLRPKPAFFTIARQLAPIGLGVTRTTLDFQTRIRCIQKPKGLRPIRCPSQHFSTIFIYQSHTYDDSRGRTTCPILVILLFGFREWSSNRNIDKNVCGLIRGENNASDRLFIFPVRVRRDIDEMKFENGRKRFESTVHTPNVESSRNRLVGSEFVVL